MRTGIRPDWQKACVLALALVLSVCLTAYAADGGPAGEPSDITLMLAEDAVRDEVLREN